VTDIGDESEASPDRPHNGRRVVGIKLPGAAARAALQVGVLRFGEDVELLSAGGRVAVAEVAELFEDTERPVHG